FFRQFFDVDQAVAGRFGAGDELVELQLDGFGILVLRLLDDKHHQESDDGGAGIDDQLPGVGKREQRAAYGPKQDDEESDDESPGAAGCGYGFAGEPLEKRDFLSSL